MTNLMQYVDVCIGNEEDAELVLGFKPGETDVTSGELELAGYKSIFEQAGYKKGDLYPAMVLMGFMLVCSVAFSLFPFRGWCLMTVGMATKAGVAINMSGWIITEVVTIAITCVGWMLIMLITPGCKVSNLKVENYCK